MKKKYLKPEVKAYAIAPCTPLAGSINNTNGKAESLENEENEEPVW